MKKEILEDVQQVLKEYNIDILSIKTESYKEKKGVWWISTPDGQKILKKQAYPYRTLEFIIAAMEYLIHNGIHIPQIIKTKKGENYVVLEKTCYVLSEAIKGKPLDYGSAENIKRVVQELAKFHKASIGFRAPANCKARTHLGEWIEKYRQQVEKVKSYYEMECSKDTHSDFGKIIVKEFPYFYERMEQAINESDQPAYHKWVEEVRKTGGLCHQDFTAGNLILDKANDIYVLDTDSITIDIPLRDIRKVLNKIIKRRGEWDKLLVKDILKWYHAENPLKSWQWEVLKPTLTYPHLFVGIMSKYYERRENSWTEEKYLKRLKQMIKIEKSLDSIIENFDGMLPLS